MANDRAAERMEEQATLPPRPPLLTSVAQSHSVACGSPDDGGDVEHFYREIMGHREDVKAT